MDEDISTINSDVRNEKIKNFFLYNRKKIIILLVAIVFGFIIFFVYGELKKNTKLKISNLYNTTLIKYSEDTKKETTDILVNIINKKDKTYSPLSLYFIIDNRLILDVTKINNLFDILIEDTPLDDEIKNLIIYKKALYNADDINESDLLKILKPLINNPSVWSSHALYLLAEYFYSKNEKEKSKEFFKKIVNLDSANPDLVIKAQKRINRDLSD
tara:strand:- start:2532 stop:3176 length:645 start_codon:yes stop_codon:yes gene_type:complete